MTGSQTYGAADARAVCRLAAAILVQAIEDIRSGSHNKRADAIRWVTDPTDRQFSFNFCCRVLSRNPEQVRRFLLAQVPPARWSLRMDAPRFFA